jgi:hypothetical protein
LTLAAGARLGPYSIVSALGAGGMGEVYRARDVTLNRDVALKVLPDLFALDVDRLAAASAAGSLRRHEALQFFEPDLRGRDRSARGITRGSTLAACHTALERPSSEQAREAS